MYKVLDFKILEKIKVLPNNAREDYKNLVLDYYVYGPEIFKKYKLYGWHTLKNERVGQVSLSLISKEYGYRLIGKVKKNNDLYIIKLTEIHNYEYERGEI